MVSNLKTAQYSGGKSWPLVCGWMMRRFQSLAFCAGPTFWTNGFLQLPWVCSSMLLTIWNNSVMWWIWTYLKPLALIAQCFCRHCCIIVFESARPGLTTERCWGLAPSHGAKTVGDCLQIISFRDEIDAAALVLWSFTMDMLKTVCQMRCVHYPLQWLGSSCSELWLFPYSLLHSKARMWRLQG